MVSAQFSRLLLLCSWSFNAGSGRADTRRDLLPKDDLCHLCALVCDISASISAVIYSNDCFHHLSLGAQTCPWLLVADCSQGRIIESGSPNCTAAAPTSCTGALLRNSLRICGPGTCFAKFLGPSCKSLYPGISVFWLCADLALLFPPSLYLISIFTYRYTSYVFTYFKSVCSL